MKAELIFRPVQSVLALFGMLASSPMLPTDHPASIQLSAWLTAFNTADVVKLVEYHNNSVFPYTVLQDTTIRTPKLEHRFAQGTGGFDVADIESTSLPNTVAVVLRERHRERYARVSMVVNISESQYPVIQFDIYPIVTPIKFIPKDDPRRPEFEKAFTPLTPDLQRKIVDEVSEHIRDQYVDPDVGAKIITALDDHVKDGDYMSFEDSQTFARQLTKDMVAASQDKHIRALFFELPPPEPRGDNTTAPVKSFSTIIRDMNFGFENVTFDESFIPGSVIATLAINTFFPIMAVFLPECQEVRAGIADIMNSVAHADMLIVDLRENLGGAPDTVAFILSYLLDNGPIHLLDFVDRTGNVKRSIRSLAPEQLPSGAQRFGGTKPLYVLTSRSTASGGEDMAYSLQAFKRASAVIGQENEVTAGAANMPTSPYFLCEEEFGGQWWHVTIPDQKPVHVVTGTNWEGVGVRSDVIAGRGEWDSITDAEEVAKVLFKKSSKLTNVV